MQLTKFLDLKAEISRIGINRFEQDLLKKVELGILEADEEKTILGKYGIYYLDKGVLIRVLAHITGKEKKWLKRKKGAIEAYNSHKYNSPDFINTLHRYHFTKCTTLNSMFSNGKGDKYFMSRKIDGSFNYNITNDNSVIFHSKKQKLYACKNCIKILEEATNNKYYTNDFKIKDIFDANIIKLDVNEFKPDCESVPNVYTKDWYKISTKAKDQVNWICENCGKKPIKKQELHCHHIDSNRGNNVISNLKVLCHRCHADEHSHMKKLSINYE